MFPNAKFIYLKRNPYTVFESTRSFFTNTIQPLRLQDISNEQIESNFIEVYRRLFYKYEEQKHLIPEGNLVEVKFEDFEQDAFAMTEDIYKKLNLPALKSLKMKSRNISGKRRAIRRTGTSMTTARYGLWKKIGEWLSKSGGILYNRQLTTNN